MNLIILCIGTPVPVSVSLVDPCTPEVELSAAVLLAKGIQVHECTHVVTCTQSITKKFLKHKNHQQHTDGRNCRNWSLYCG